MIARRPGEHRDPLAPVPLTGARPHPGPVAIMPDANAAFESAVVAGGGTVEPLSGATRGLVWLTLDGPALAQVLAAHPSIEWVQLPMAGVEPFAALLAAQGDADLPVWTSAKGSFAEPVAEHAVALTLAVLRGLPDKARGTSWARPRTGISLYGRRVVIVGAGGIAVELLRLLAPWQVHVTIVRRSADALDGADRTVPVSRLAEVLPDADVLILAAAATADTAHLIDAAALALLPPTAALINVARGALVDQEALVAALHSGHLAGAGIDVTTPEPLPDGHPLWSAPRAIVTSHSADTLEMIVPLLAERVRANVAALQGDSAFVGRVDPLAGY